MATRPRSEAGAAVYSLPAATAAFGHGCALRNIGADVIVDQHMITRVEGPLVAVYATQGDAQAARRGLIAAGISPGAISVLNAAPFAETRTPSPTAIKGIWAKLKDFIGFDMPRLNFAGHSFLDRQAALTIDPPATARERVIRLIHATGPENFNPGGS